MVNLPMPSISWYKSSCKRYLYNGSLVTNVTRYRRAKAVSSWPRQTSSRCSRYWSNRDWRYEWNAYVVWRLIPTSSRKGFARCYDLFSVRGGDWDRCVHNVMIRWYSMDRTRIRHRSGCRNLVESMHCHTVCPPSIRQSLSRVTASSPLVQPARNKIFYRRHHVVRQ